MPWHHGGIDVHVGSQHERIDGSTAAPVPAPPGTGAPSRPPPPAMGEESGAHGGDDPEPLHRGAAA
ncbi:hypothetical protein HML84_14825 [Alcanivorax sp. IO_7]|nr:hypothetical protein HML84_14825 [Alcanivorax sp. IO_7]